MSTQPSVYPSLIEQLQIHLRTEGYSPSIQRGYPTVAHHFLDYCESKALVIEAVRARHVKEFLQRKHRAFRSGTDSRRHFKNGAGDTRVRFT